MTLALSAALLPALCVALPGATGGMTGIDKEALVRFFESDAPAAEPDPEESKIVIRRVKVGTPRFPESEAPYSRTKLIEAILVGLFLALVAVHRRRKHRRMQQMPMGDLS